MLAACGAPPAPPAKPVVVERPMPKLLAPMPADPGARGAAYLAQVALRLQPGWGQFLDDCRLRLPESHPLNRLELAARIELEIDGAGRITDVQLATSGNPDFDRAVRDALADASPLPAPPPDLMSDDDRVHVRWLFARDRRQAGPATAEVAFVELPLGGVIEYWLDNHELARAARRIATAPPDDVRTAAIQALALAVLEEAFRKTEDAGVRAALDAVRAAKLRELAGDVHGFLAPTFDADLRRSAIATIRALNDTGAVSELARHLAEDLHTQLAAAEAAALVSLGSGQVAATALAAALDTPGDPDPVALEAAGSVAVPQLAHRLAGWSARGDARTRAGVCAVAPLADPAHAARWIDAGLRDADATVRARCAEAAGVHGIKPALPRLRELTRDRDRTVRARAVTAIAAVYPAHLPHLADDPAGEVRAAYAAALATDSAELRALADDRDAEVRAAAWAALVAAGVHDAGARAVHDPSPEVRRAAVPALPDDVVERLASADDSPDVRGAALVEWARRRGRTASEPVLLARIAETQRGSPDRVAAALAWLLAR
ncbi:MAG TPA: TonB family protein [Kofleriaceae bacterium]